jgi:hypothetical protein
MLLFQSNMLSALFSESEVTRIPSFIFQLLLLPKLNYLFILLQVNHKPRFGIINTDDDV